MPIQTALDSISQNQGSPFGFKNRIINGGMVIDQRNGGSSVTPANGGFVVDRWGFGLSQSSKLTAQQSSGSVTPPVGFSKYVGVTSSSAYSVISSDVFSLHQGIEGFNMADLGWGASTGSTVTVSFWVRSSLTGTFAFQLQNYAQTYSYVATYTINASNTWEYKIITIPTCPSGSWSSDSGGWGYMRFVLGAGSTYQTASPNSWVSGNYWATSSTVSVVGTNAATFYVTGVQLEKGNQATSFDWRPYSNELSLCHRYYQDFRTGTHRSGFPLINVITGDVSRVAIFPGLVSMRSAPTITTYATDNTTSGVVTLFSAGSNQNVSSVNQNGGPNIGSGYLQLSGNVSNPVYFGATYSAEL